MRLRLIRFKKLISAFGLVTLLTWALTIGLHYGQMPIVVAQSPAPEQAADVDPNHVKIEISLLGFDPIKGELDARMVLFPMGDLIDQKNGFPSADLQLTDIESIAKQQFDIKKGKPPESPVTKYITIEGDAFSYPLDEYKTTIGLYVDKLPPQPEAPKGGATDKPAAPPAVNEADVEAVPLEYEFSPNLAGFNVTFNETKESKESDDYLELDVTITRSLPVIFFSSVVMVIMWALSLIILLISITILRSGRMPETGALGFMGALLFAFPAIRNAQPNVPPVGTLSDFLSFFWTEAIVVIALVITGACWLRRYNPPAK
ncbi:hypothetical protein BST81_04625 [Leptolyngbya sp. 'hensonii']|uniref:DUF4436 family protein n=1 Tax=Leptolyngbya sp. 'hensonii' TaxID=1922337 RepID=UPI000950000A|nr:DUF4436 family protein [Leptolyngbya sp. 'hensonii']OLP19560.1 hypothetical protein BST81_04625 [Leptolyngbya sp. 'hensonii']